MKRLVVLVSGSGSNLQALIDKTKDKTINAQIVAVYSNKKDAYGLVRAKEAGIDSFILEDYNQIDQHKADGIILAGFLKIIPGSFIDKYKNKIINIHPSLIPSFCGKGYYGLKVHQAVVDYGAKITGATTHFVSEGADEGPIIMQRTVEVKPTDTAIILQKRVLEIEHQLLIDTVQAFCADQITLKNRTITIEKGNI